MIMDLFFIIVRVKRKKVIKYRELGQTGLTISEIGFGSWGIGGISSVLGYGPVNDDISKMAVKTAIEMGCNFFDTADCYGQGHSERILGSILSKQRSNVIIATKSGIDFYHGYPKPNFHPDYIRFAIYQSLRRLQTDYIDLFLLHNPPPSVIYSTELIEELGKLKQSGKLHFIGVSASDTDTAIAACYSGWPDVIEVHYNMLAPEAELYLFPLSKSMSIGIIAREVLANGFLTGKFVNHHYKFPSGDIRSLWPLETIKDIIKLVEKIKPFRRSGETLAQLAIRFVLESSAVSTVVCGCKSSTQVKENFQASKIYKSGRVE